MPSSLSRCSSVYLSGLKRKGSGYRELSCRTALQRRVFERTVHANESGSAPDVGENRGSFRDEVSSIFVVLGDRASKTKRSHWPTQDSVRPRCARAPIATHLDSNEGTPRRCGRYTEDQPYPRKWVAYRDRLHGRSLPGLWFGPRDRP